MTRLKGLIGIGVLALMFMLTASVASADVLNGTLSFTNSGDIGAGPYGTVQITFVDSHDVNVVFTAAAGYLFVADNSVGLSLTTITGVSMINPVSNGEAVTADFTLNQKVDGIGSYDVTLKQKDASNGASLISFTLACATCNWTNVHSIIKQPDTDNPFNSWLEAHVAFQTNCTAEKACTGFVGGNVDGVPEPGTLTLLGLGLVAGGTLVRRFKKR
jgi:hypothetical protein